MTTTLAKRPSSYAETIRESMARMGLVGAADPRWVEAWMRLEHGCLDGLGHAQFDHEVAITLLCIDEASTRENEALAESMGF